MCWWHMATHWQLGVQVQEQTWVLKSQLAEAKFSACALGASMPGKCSANTTPLGSLASPAAPGRCLLGDHECSSDREWREHKEVREMKAPRAIPHFKPANTQNSIATEFLWHLGDPETFPLDRPCRRRSLWICDRTHIREWWLRTVCNLLQLSP